MDVGCIGYKYRFDVIAYMHKHRDGDRIIKMVAAGRINTNRYNAIFIARTALYMEHAGENLETRESRTDLMLFLFTQKEWCRGTEERKDGMSESVIERRECIKEADNTK